MIGYQCNFKCKDNRNKNFFDLLSFLYKEIQVHQMNEVKYKNYYEKNNRKTEYSIIYNNKI